MNETADRQVTCPRCAGTRKLVTIQIDLRDGILRLQACPACEFRWWQRDGEILDREELLEVAAVEFPRRRRRSRR